MKIPRWPSAQWLCAVGIRPLSDQEKNIGINIIYNEACGYAHVDNVEKALTTLALAVELGLNDFALIMNDTDLIEVRKHADFEPIREAVKKAAAGPDDRKDVDTAN